MRRSSAFDDTIGDAGVVRGKPVVMNFFSSTCAACRTEMPAIEHVPGRSAFSVTFLGMDVQDTVEAAKAFVDTVGITGTSAVDPDGAVLQQLVKWSDCDDHRAR